MKRVIIGDIHGHSSWRDIYDKEQPDQVIILGDYCDSFCITAEDQIINFNNLMETKKLHEESHGKNSFITLLGNHDFHYIKSDHIHEKYSGWKSHTLELMGGALLEAIDGERLSICYVDYKNNIIFSHAGISNTWLTKRCNKCSLDNVNSLSFEYFTFSYKGYGDCFGSSIWNGPLWIRPNGLKDDPVLNEDNKPFTQIVGHTYGKTYREYKYSYYKDDPNILIVIDCMPFYYMVQELDDNGLIANQWYESFK